MIFERSFGPIELGEPRRQAAAGRPERWLSCGSLSPPHHAPLLCIKEGTCEWPDCVLRVAAAELGFGRSLCVCLGVCISVLMVILENPDDLCLILYECARLAPTQFGPGVDYVIALEAFVTSSDKCRNLTDWFCGLALDQQQLKGSFITPPHHR